MHGCAPRAPRPMRWRERFGRASFVQRLAVVVLTFGIIMTIPDWFSSPLSRPQLLPKLCSTSSTPSFCVTTK